MFMLPGDYGSGDACRNEYCFGFYSVKKNLLIDLLWNPALLHIVDAFLVRIDKEEKPVFWTWRVMMDEKTNPVFIVRWFNN